ncbi:MAG: VCBS repeat-containing protein, partial [Planctomycetota bacterium]|nr:VCBS repeat-containing protein [Planctomycetota bacterium]
VSDTVQRSCAPDPVAVTLKLKPGRNVVLLKVTQGSGEFAYCYSLKYAEATPTQATAPTAAVAARPIFEDVSEKVGLPALGLRKGDHLAVADVNADERPDFLFSAGTGLLVINTPQGFVEAKDSGISYQSGKVAPAFGDFDGDKLPDLFVPQRGRCKLFRNNGKGRFSDVTAGAGALGLPLGHATCAAWADFNNRGRLDLLVGCLKGPNRFFRNNGNGTFSDATEEIGLGNRIFNTRGISVLDINKDGVLDVVLINEGQESAVLLGSPARLALAAAQEAARNPLGPMGIGTLDSQGNPIEPAGTGSLDLRGNSASSR